MVNSIPAGRRFLAGAVALLWMVFAAACGQGESASTTSGGGAPPSQPVESVRATQSPAEVALPPATWSTRAALPASNSEIAVAEVNRKVYAIGGYPSSRVVVDTVQEYDLDKDSWRLATPLPRPLHHVMAAGVNGKLYVIGGEIAGAGATAGGLPPGVPGFTDSVYEYDPATGVWTSKSSMPTARSGGVAAVIDGKIYVAGGRPPGGHDFAVYDPRTDTWTKLPDLPTQRNHLAATAIGGKMYVAGGRFGGGVGSEMTAVLEVYDPRTNRWERKASMPAPRAGVNGVEARGCFFVFGGEGNDAHPQGVFEEMEAYNPVTDTWTKLQPLPMPVHGVTGAVFADGWIHLVGGGTARGGSSGSTLHQVYRPDMTCT